MLPRFWFPLLFGLCCALQTTINRIWLSSVISPTFNLSVVDQHCRNASLGGKALVCTASRNVSTFFLEEGNLTTKGSGGSWDLVNPVAYAGNLGAALFTQNGLLNTIKDVTGANRNADITHSCDANGNFLPGMACGGNYDINDAVGQAISGSSGSSTAAWVGGTTTGAFCNMPVRFYCGAVFTIIPVDTENPTMAPTSSPSSSPSPAPTPPTVPPTSLPTSSPTTFHPTLFPFFPPPTTPLPTAAPSMAPTSSPSSSAPTNGAVVTSAPSKAPTCSDCTITIFPGNSSNTTVTIGPTGGPVVVTIPPTAIPNCSNCSVVIVLTPTPSGPQGGSGVLTIDVVDNGTTRPNVSLQAAFTFFMPYSADLVGCTGPVVADCVWRDSTEWVNSGCSSKDMDTGTLCTCTHFTDFAVLLDESAPHPCQSRTDSSEVFFVLIACYALLFVYCVLAVFRLCYAGAKQSRGVMLLQHSLIGAVCVLRVLSCLNYLGTFGDAMGLSAFVAAAPYPLEYLLFTKFASTWAGLVHFSMLSTEARWKKIRPLFYSINVIGTCLAVGLFVMFYVESSFESALAGTVVLAVLYLALATAFSLYASKLVKELAKASKSSSATSGGASRRKCGVETKIRLLGHLAALCFVVQALCSVLALALPSEQLVGWTATFCFFNIVALLCILVVYSAAVLKAPKATLRHSDTTSSGFHGTQELQAK